MPALIWEIETPISTHVDRAEDHTNRWARRLRLVQPGQQSARLAATRSGELAGRCYPSASGDDLCLAADWISWLFVVDDETDEGGLGRRPDQCEQVLADLHSAAFDPSPLANPRPPSAALADIWNRVRHRMPGAWRRRFLAHVGEYFAANTWQAAHRALDELPDPDSFAVMRRHAGAIWPSFDLIEYAAHTALPPGLYYSRTYQALLTSAADVVCWTNDIMTLPKELAQKDVHNLVLVRQQAEGSSLEAAIASAARLTNLRIQQFLDAELRLPELLARLQLPQAHRAAVRDCVAALRAWMRGHVEWGAGTYRYRVGEDSALWSTYDRLGRRTELATGQRE